MAETMLYVICTSPRILLEQILDSKANINSYKIKRVRYIKKNNRRFDMRELV